VDSSVAFCVVDRRTSPRRRIEELERLGATAVRDHDGVTQLASGAPVDEEIGLVMLTSGSKRRAQSGRTDLGGTSREAPN